MKLQDLITTGRALDPHVPTNLAIGIATVVAIAGGVAYEFATGGVGGLTFLRGLGLGISVFAAWALCRELDPDHDLSAFVAAALSVAGLALWGLPQFVAVAWMLVVLRVANRTTGLPARLLDMLGVIGLSAWLAVLGNWGYGIIAALALLIEGRLPPRRRLPLWMAGLALAVTLIAAAITGWPHAIAAIRWSALGIALAILLLFVPVFLASRQVESVGDQTGDPLAPGRVRAGQALAALAGIEAVLWQGQPGLQWLSPLWAAFLGAAIWWLVLRIRPAKNPQHDEPGS